MALGRHDITQKATIPEEQGAFNRYANSFSISYINLEGLKGLSYPGYQGDRLKLFLNSNTGVKVLVHVGALTDQGDTINFKSRRYEVLNTADIQQALIDMVGVLKIRLKMHLSRNEI